MSTFSQGVKEKFAVSSFTLSLNLNPLIDIFYFNLHSLEREYLLCNLHSCRYLKTAILQCVLRRQKSPSECLACQRVKEPRTEQTPSLGLQLIPYYLHQHCCIPIILINSINAMRAPSSSSSTRSA